MPKSPPPVQEERLSPVRRGANLRSVNRTDRAIVDILEFTDHATVFLNDETGEWKKTKMEGPTFIVRRSKKPHYAVYMLNRMGLKNVLIPLIPGDIKTVPLNNELLQIRKRGEEGRSLWIPIENDATGITRFHNVILQICGEPMKQSEAGESRTSSTFSATTGLLAPQLATSDPFARLFNTAKPSAQSSAAPFPQSAPQIAASSDFRYSANQINVPIYASHLPSCPSSFARQQAAAVSPSLPAEAGHNVDRLLQNLLSPSTSNSSPDIRSTDARAPSPNAITHRSAQTSAPPSAQRVSPAPQSNVTGQAPRRGRVGDSTFAQATRTRPAPKLSPEDRRKLIEAVAATLAYRHGSSSCGDRNQLDQLQGSVRSTLVDPAFADEVWAMYLAAIDAL